MKAVRKRKIRKRKDQTLNCEGKVFRRGYWITCAGTLAGWKNTLLIWKSRQSWTFLLSFILSAVQLNVRESWMLVLNSSCLGTIWPKLKLEQRGHSLVFWMEKRLKISFRASLRYHLPCWLRNPAQKLGSLIISGVDASTSNRHARRLHENHVWKQKCDTLLPPGKEAFSLPKNPTSHSSSSMLGREGSSFCAVEFQANSLVDCTCKSFVSAFCFLLGLQRLSEELWQIFICPALLSTCKYKVCFFLMAIHTWKEICAEN
jgi:hypothetical protein